MADLLPYERTFSFSGFQANKPNQPLPAVQLDRELDDIAARLTNLGKTAFEVAQDNGFVGGIGDWLLSLVGPRGPQGIQGLQGLQGLQGIPGLKGDTGLQGIPGIQGLKGDTGPQGLQGVKGDTGAQGLQGVQGLKGDTGAQGIQGIQGIQGLKGDTGAQGAGVTIKGSTASPSTLPTSGATLGDTYIMTGSGTGYTAGDGYVFTNSGADSGPGNNWKNVGQIRGPQGLKGDTGSQGIQGVQGNQGTQGVKGDTGAQGVQGVQGTQGPQGNPTAVNGKTGSAITLVAADVGALANTGGTVAGQVTAGDPTQLAPIALQAAEANVAGQASRRAQINIGANWLLAQDVNQSGIKDLTLSSGAGTALGVGVDNILRLPQRPIFAGQTPFDTGNVPAARKAINFLNRQFFVSDYGGGENISAANNVTAFNNCYYDLVAQGGGTLVLPPGECQYAGAIGNNNPQAVGIRIVGGGPKSRVLFIGSGVTNGLLVNCDRPILEGFRVTGYATPNIGGGYLVYVRNSADPTNSWGQPVIQDLAIEGNPDSIPYAFLHVYNPQFARIRGLAITARNTTLQGAGNSRGLLVASDTASNKSSLGDWSVEGATIYGAKYGIEVICGSADGTPTVEGTSFTDCAIVGGTFGLYMHSQGYYSPGYTWKGGHINVIGTPFWLSKMSQFTIADTQVYLNNAVNGNAGFVYLADSNNVFIRDNKFFQAPAGGAAIDQTIYGVSIDAASYQNKIYSNDFIGMNANSAMIYMTGTGGANRAYYNGRTGTGPLISGNVGDLGGNHRL